MLTHDRLLAALNYDPVTGVFAWKVSTNGRIAIGQKAGWTSSNGHRSVTVDGKTYKEHRLAWFYVHGVWPTHQIDHKDVIPGNNALTNLRDATQFQNQRNKGKYKSNKSGYKGVCWKARNRKWVAQAKLDNKVHHLGLFATAAEASVAYQEFVNQHHGEFKHSTGEDHGCK